MATCPSSCLFPPHPKHLCGPTSTLLVAQMIKNLPAMQEAQVGSLGQEDPLEKGMAPTPVFLPGEFHGLRATVDGVAKSRTGLSD